MNNQAEHDFLMHVLKGHEEAVALVETVAMVSQVWDDLIDGDREVSRDQINRAFRAALYQIPMNPFYQRHSVKLIPLMDAFILDWINANALEKMGESGKRLAFVLRDASTALAVHCAELIGGFEWAQEVGPKIWLYACDESYEAYAEGCI